ncbi:hypothetical protein KY326_02530 [Candidatus Woesearchaeota archaeon]|nr:hypothetical protein [Candidatus Woesearchaeota archaeon]
MATGRTGLKISLCFLASAGVAGGLAGAVTVPYYAIKAGYEGVFGTNNCNR